MRKRQAQESSTLLLPHSHARDVFNLPYMVISQLRAMCHPATHTLSRNEHPLLQLTPSSLPRRTALSLDEQSPCSMNGLSPCILDLLAWSLGLTPTSTNGLLGLPLPRQMVSALL